MLIALYTFILSVAFLSIECFAGGTRLIYSLPVYTLLAVASLLTVFSIKKTKNTASPACLISTAIFFGYILVRCRLSPVDYLSRTDFFMVLGSLVIYLLTALHIVKAKHRAWFLAVLFAIALGEVAVGMIQFSRGNDFMLFGYARPLTGSRASGQYISPNHLAGYLEVISVIAISMVVWSTWRPWAKILTGYVALVTLAGVVITCSRGGYVSTVSCLLCFCILSAIVVKIAFPERLTRVLWIGGIVILLASISLPALITSDLVRTRASAVFTRDMRLALWQAALTQIKIDPLYGTGSGSYLYYGRKFRNPGVQPDPVRVHNDYLDLIAEYGFLGAAGFFLFLASHLWGGIHTFRWLLRKRLQFSVNWQSTSLALNIGGLCAVAAYIVHSGVDFNLHIPANALLMAFIFGVLANPGLETAADTKKANTTNVIFQILLPALGLAIFALGTPKIPGEYYAEKARVALRDKDYAGSIDASRAGIRWEKQNPNLYYYLGEARCCIADSIPVPALRTSVYRSASDAYKQALEVFPQDERLLLAEGWTLDAQGKYTEGGEYFDKALEWDPNSNQVTSSYLAHEELVQRQTDTPNPTVTTPPK